MDRYLLKSKEACRTVELWSETRLPFDLLTPALKDMRDALRAAVRALAAADGEVLRGVFASSLKDPCDAENILFYNVGSSPFQRSSTNGVRFERTHTVPPAADALGFVARSYHRYELVARDEAWQYWRRGSALAVFSEAEVPRLTSETKVHQIWQTLSPVRRLRNAGIRTGTPFGIQLSIQVPSRAPVNTTAIIKPLLDAAISSCHVHDGSALAVLAKRLGELLGENPAAIAHRLMDDNNAVLGRRRLLSPRATGFQWNPADDACVAASVDIVHTDRDTDGQWLVSGELVDIVAR